MADLDVILRSGVLTAVPRQYAGKILQIVRTEDATAKSTTATFPQDDTIPQSGEGTAYTELDTAITPKFSSSNLLVCVDLAAFASASMRSSLGIWRDSGASAIATREVASFQHGHALTCMTLVAAGSTSATTFKVRFARNSGTLYLNDFSTALYGGASKSHMTIFEIAG